MSNGQSAISFPLFSAPLQTMASKLDGLFVERDGAFVAIGQGLGDAISEIGKVTAVFEALPALLENDALNEATERVFAVSRTINAIGDATEEEDTALGELVGLNREVAQRLRRLQQSIRTISILTSNAKIEAASLDTTGSSFSDFTMEIAQLARKAQDTVDSYLREHDKLVMLLNAACKAHQQFLRKYQNTVLSVSGDLDVTLQAVAARRHDAASSAVEIAHSSKRINEAISTAIMALQINDTTRQRIEHVQFALETLVDGITPPSDAGEETEASPLMQAEQEGIVAAVCRLQAVQVDDALEEYEGELDKIHDSLTLLVQECHRIGQQGRELYGSTGRETGSFLESLKVKLAAAVGLIHDCQTARDTVNRATATVATTVKQLRSQVSSVSQIVLDMTLVGMNAALKSRQLGSRGRGLGIIADELRDYAHQIAQDADALMPAFGRVIGSAENLENMQLTQDSDSAYLDKELAHALNGFDSCAATLGEALETLSVGATDLRKLLQDCTVRIERQKRAPVALRQIRLDLDKLSEPATLASDEFLISDIMDELFGLFWSRYTMVSERRIHERFEPRTKGGSVGGSPSSSLRNDAAVGDELDDVLFA
ncbi:MAG: hypothetical protein ACYC5H_00625 [Methylovirgula sp.]